MVGLAVGTMVLEVPSYPKEMSISTVVLKIVETKFALVVLLSSRGGTITNPLVENLKTKVFPSKFESEVSNEPAHP